MTLVFIENFCSTFVRFVNTVDLSKLISLSGPKWDSSLGKHRAPRTRRNLLAKMINLDEVPDVLSTLPCMPKESKLWQRCKQSICGRLHGDNFIIKKED